MIEPAVRTLLFVPTGEYVEARVVTLTPEMADSQIADSWWRHPDVKSEFQPQPIDRLWNWNDVSIELDGEIIPSEKIAIVTGDGMVQGAMLISTDPVDSGTEPGKGCLFVELLFTAPHNRPNLRRDGRMYFAGVGTELLTWGAWFSRERGHEGRLKLDGSPDFLDWYAKRGLQRLHANPIVFEGVSYTPMELPAPAARKLLEDW